MSERALVVALGAHPSTARAWWWVAPTGKGWVLSEHDGHWWPINDASGFGGSVLSDAAVAQLVERFGSPEVKS